MTKDFVDTIWQLLSKWTIWTFFFLYLYWRNFLLQLTEFVAKSCGFFNILRILVGFCSLVWAKLVLQRFRPRNYHCSLHVLLFLGKTSLELLNVEIKSNSTKWGANMPTGSSLKLQEFLLIIAPLKSISRKQCCIYVLLMLQGSWI